MATNAALIVAAGRGHRVGGPLPKQYRALAGRMVLGHSVRRFTTHPRVDCVRVVIDPADRPLYDDAVQGSEDPEARKLLAPVAGGETRQDSVRNGLESLSNSPPDLVLIHDGARPLVTEAVIDGALDALAGHDGALPALAVSDSLKRAAPGSVVIAGAVPREGLWRAQTPQGFRYSAILDAHRAAAGNALTDDAAVAEHAGLSVALTAGDEDNLKITTEQDFARAERIMTAQGEREAAAALALETRVGMGFDVHRFGPATISCWAAWRCRTTTAWSAIPTATWCSTPSSTRCWAPWRRAISAATSHPPTRLGGMPIPHTSWPTRLPC